MQSTAFRLLLGTVLAIASLSGGCAPVEWTTITHKQGDIQWPPSPLPTKVKYVGELEGFTQVGKSVAAMLVGTDKSSGALVKPVSIAVARDGRMAVADYQRKGIHLYVPQTKSYKLLYRAKDTLLESPVSVVFDDESRLYVSDSSHAKVFIFDQKGEFLGILGGEKVETGKSIKRPTGLAYRGGKLFVVDTGSHKVQIFDTHQNFVTSLGGRGVDEGAFNLPTHIAVDQENHVLVNDAMNFRIQVFDSERKPVAMFGRHGDGSGDFAMSKGLAVDRWGVVYVVDTLFETVQLFHLDGAYLLNVGTQGSRVGEFWMPSGLFIDHEDKLYVCDTFNRRVQIFQLFHGEGKEERKVL